MVQQAAHPAPPCARAIIDAWARLLRVLRHHPQELQQLNQALATYIASSAAMEVSKLAIQKFMYTGLVAAVAAPMVLASFSSVIDTPWGVALNRAVKVASPCLVPCPAKVAAACSTSSMLNACSASVNAVCIQTTCEYASVTYPDVC